MRRRPVTDKGERGCGAAIIPSRNADKFSSNWDNQLKDWDVKNANISLYRTALRSSTVLVAAAAIAAPAFAQEQEQETAADETIIVTGSRIARPDVESSSPVTVVSAAELNLSGATRVEDLINSLPQVIGGQTAFISNGASGTASVDLRGLGTARTLVLVNGRRLQPGDPTFPVADLNQIPGSLVERVDVLTGGASTAYGADAVAGVVNFIMDSNFEGFRIDTQYGFYQHKNRNNQVVDSVGGTDFTIRDRLNARGFTFRTGNVVDGQTFDATATFGAGFDDGRGHLTAYVGYRQVEPIFQRDRDHSSCALSESRSSSRITCGGSGTAPNATIADPTFGDLFFGTADGSDDFSGTLDPAGNGPYNYAPINYFQRPDKRWTAGAFAEYEVNSSVKPYAEFMFMDGRSVAQIAESGTFFNQYDVSCTSPLLTPAQGALLCASIEGDPDVDPVIDGRVPLLIGKRNVEGGPRRDDLRHTSFRTVFGVRGDISDNWRYDVYGQYGTSILAQTYFNDLSSSRLARALDAVVDTRPGSGTFGQIVCAVNADATSANDDAACAPYNPFQGRGLVTDPAQGVTQAAINYVSVPGFQRGDTKEYIASGYVSGELGSLFGASPVGLVVGAEYRKEKLETNVDSAFATGDLAGQGGPTPNVVGEFNVKEVFGELLVPIVEDKPFAKSLSLELAYRYSDYSTAGTTNTYKIGGEWSPVSAIKLRGGYNRAVRAPNIINLFSPQRIALFGGADPCAGATPTFTVAQCLNTGVPASAYGTVAASPADQYNQFIGGNVNLDPETADTWTLGLVLQPEKVVPGLVVKVDYYNIKVKDAITTYGAQTILNQCGLSGDATFCSLVNRDPISYNLWVGQNGFVTNLTLNTGGFETSGVDVAASYVRDVGPGRFSLDFNGTYLDEFIVDNGFQPSGVAGGDGKYDCTGFFGSVCGTPYADWKHTMRVGYTFDKGFGLSLKWRYVNAVKIDEFSSDPDLGIANPDQRAKIGAKSFFDVVGTIDIDEHFDLAIGVNNILDKDPPLVPASWGSTNANTFVETYDPAGRYVFISASAKF
jgi:outer membrane receptor protein involved in Fe transport